MKYNSDEGFMSDAIGEAKKAKQHGDLPFGAVVVHKDKVIGKGKCENVTGIDVTAHAELLAIREACQNLKSNNLTDCAIYCTNEPCVMCAAGIFQAGIAEVYIGVSRNELPNLLRPRKIRIDHLAKDSGHKIEIKRGLLKEKILELFKDIKKK